MKNATANQSHTLVDTIGDGWCYFTPLGNGNVLLSSSEHDDCEPDTTEMPIEEARNVYRRLVKSGYVAE